MPDFLFKALLLMTATVLSTGALAQEVYKCGDTYSQTPCPGGVTVNAADPRTHAQKVQTEKSTVRDARSAQAMQKSRLQQESKDLASNTKMSMTPAQPKASAAETSQLKKKKKKAAEFFTAKDPAEKIKKTPTTTDAGKKDVSKP